MKKLKDAEYIDVLYDIKHAPFDENTNSAEGFNSILVTPMFNKLAAINVAKDVWAKEKGEVHVYEETWEDDYLAEKKLVFVKTNDGEEYDEARIKRAMARDSSVRDVVKKTPEGYVVFSEKGKKLSKAYATKKEAEARLAQIEMFKHIKKDSASYMGYEIRNAKGHYEVWKGEERLSSADTYSEAVSDIEEMLEEDGKEPPKIPAPKPKPKPEKPKMHRYRVWYVLNNADEQSMYEDVYAESPEQARKKVKAMYGNMIYKQPHDVYLLDAGGESMTDEEYEALAKSAGKEAQALLDFYEMSEEAGELYMSVYDSLGLPNDGEWVIEPSVLEDKAKITQLFNAVRKAIIDKANKKQLHSLLSPHDQRYSADESEDKLLKAFNIRVVYDSLAEIQVELDGELDKLTNEAYREYCKCIESNPEGEFKYSEKLEQLLNKIGNFTSSTTTEILGMFKEMAEVEEIKGKKRKLDSAPVSKAVLEKKVKRILAKYLKEKGYSPKDIEDYVVVNISEKIDEDGEPYVKVQIRNDLVGWYKLPEGAQDELDALFKPYNSYIEPYDATTWDGYMWGAKLKDAKPEDEADSAKLVGLLNELNAAIKGDGFAGPNWGFEAKHMKEGNKDFIIFEGNKEHKGSDEESDTATNLDAIINREYPGSELLNWNDDMAGCKWELKK